jgi:hypothetical protein
VTDDALIFAAKMLKLELTEQRRQRLLRGFLEPDFRDSSSRI